MIFGRISTVVQSQNQDDIEWCFAVKKTSVNTFNIHVTALINPPWHIYEKLLNIQESSLLSITYEYNDNTILSDDLHVVGVPIEQYDNAIKNVVRYYTVAVNFVQKVSLIVDEPLTLKGQVAYVIGDGISKVETRIEKFKITLND